MENPNHKRVVVTGYGTMSPLGKTAKQSWENLIRSKSGVGPITLFDTSNCPVQYAAEVKDFDPTAYVEHREARRYDRHQLLALAAATEAMEHSGLEITEGNRQRIGVVISSGVGGLDTLYDQAVVLKQQGPRRMSPFGIPRIMTNGSAALVSIRYGMTGPSFCVTSACASANDGIGIAMRQLRAGVSDAIVAGGTEAGINEYGICSFDRIGTYSHREDHTPSPFSADRDGLVMGEGAGILVLETEEHAKARGAEIYGEIAGYGATADANHITAPCEDGAGSGMAIQLALEDARIDPTEIDYVNAHGTGTQLNDAAETRAIKRVFGDHAYQMPVSSTKSMTGHILGATGALEAIFCLQAIKNNIAPPTINYSSPDPECDLDYVPNEARETSISTTISNAFGFGGHNAVLIIKDY
ncbi:MAG: beta-ketoacyl-ACP synthase II [Anaerolineae bacterium]|nr:beta-ketoacyl-ACP synthase II [Anaerolineae bacterium]